MEIFGKTLPRLYTKPLECNVNPLTGELREDCTDGPACIRFARIMLGIELFPWQEWIFNHGLELTADKMLYRFRIVIVMVARQCGKTMVENILALWHMYSLETGLVIGTAQDLARSEEAWKDCLALAELDDELNEQIVDRNFGHPKFFNLSNGCEYRVAASSRRGGRGFTGDLVLLDEFREHHNFDSWASVTNTMNARPLAQAWAFSNAGDALSVPLRYQRALAHRELGWPDGDEDADLLGNDADVFKELAAADLPEGWDELTTGFFEWSAPPGAKRTDIDAIAQANPSLNIRRGPTLISLRNLLGQLRSTPPLEYDQEVLCRFVQLADGGPFPEDSWRDTFDEIVDGEPTTIPVPDAEIVVCVEVSSRRDMTAVARAGLADGDIAVVGIIQDRAGTDWVVDYLIETRDTYKAIVIRTEAGSPSLNLFEDLQNATLEDKEDAELPLVEWSGSDVQAGHADMFDRLRDRRIRHYPHKGLDMAATSAVALVNPGGGWRVDIRKSPSDTAPLLAGIGAIWGLDHLPETESVYETSPVLVIPRRAF